jgi:nicotinate-nucleotide pyrophosphorylase (carboxylating)
VAQAYYPDKGRLTTMLSFDIKAKAVQDIIALALSEDCVFNDVTSQAIIPEDLCGSADLTAKAEGILAGIDIFNAVYQEIDPELGVEIYLQDGSRVVPGSIAARVKGKARNILAGERTALNFLCHLSGIASLTALYVAEVKDFNVNITDTRKTLPGMRILEKYAVGCGGGYNHRFNLCDGILIKDNHIAALRHTGKTLKDIVLQARRQAPAGLEIEVEVTSMTEAIEAADAGADIVLLDNMNPEAMRQVAQGLAGKVKLEASGGINLQSVRMVASSGVNRISCGSLTHSAGVLDFSLEMK